MGIEGDLAGQLEINTDGACSGNPGEAGIGVIIRRGGREVWTLSKAIGPATNNIAEYLAVIYALQQALILKADEVLVRSDSELLVRQCQGKYKVKNPEIKRLFDQVQHLRAGFRNSVFEHIPREKNAEADGLSKKAIKKEQAKVVALELNFGEESPSSTG